MSGRHTAWLEEAITAATAEGVLVDADKGLLSAARAAAFGLDEAEKLTTAQKPGYVISQLLSPYRDILAELKLTPASRDKGKESDEMEVFLNGLGSPSHTGT